MNRRKKNKKRKAPKVSFRNEREVKFLPPKMFRRLERRRKNKSGKRRNDGQLLNSANFISLMTMKHRPYMPTFPNRKFKGWQRENRRYKKAA